MIKKKLVSFALLGTISAGAILPALQSTTTVYAAESSNVAISEDTIGLSNFDSMIEDIENNYLKQNNDGTFYLSNNIYDSIYADAVDLIKSSMEDINSLILANKLEFKIENSGQNKEVVNTKNTVDINAPITRSIDSFGTVLSSSKYSSNHVFYWWGFTAKVNKAGADLMKSDFTMYAAIYGSGTFIFSYIPGGAALVKAAGIGTTITFAVAINQCNKGVISGKGVNVKSLGKPTFGQIVSVQAIL